MKIICLGDHADCAADPGCVPFATELHTKLAGGDYDWPASILNLDDMAAYTAAHRTARKRASRAERLSYRFDQISRSDFNDDIYDINTSKDERQGRPMSDGYQHRHEFAALPSYLCIRHRIDEYGVLYGGRLVAYLVLYVCGDLALVSQILGHADHLASDVMYLLALGAFNATLERSGPAAVFYNRWDSGTDGLRFFKERLGFERTRVQWSLQ